MKNYFKKNQKHITHVTPVTTSDFNYLYHERIAIMEHDGNINQEEAKINARRETLEEMIRVQNSDFYNSYIQLFN